MIAGTAAALALAFTPVPAPVSAADPIGDLIQSLDVQPAGEGRTMRATLYRTGVGGVGLRDSLGCRPQPMRTLATDPKVVPRHSIVFIKETVGLRLPGGGAHDGYWYASDTGGAIKGDRVDLYAGTTAAAMRPFIGFKLNAVSVVRVGTFDGCPPAGPADAPRVASR